MNTFRIAIDGGSSQALIKLLDTSFLPWHLQSYDRDGEVTLRLIPGETTELRFSLLAGCAVRQAVHIVSMAGSIPVRCIWTVSQPNMVVIQISPQDRAQVTIFQNVAWALFLWAASRHPGHEAFQGFERLSLSQNHNFRRSSKELNTSLAAFSQQTQPLSRPARSQSVRSPTPMIVSPMAESLKNKGG